MANHRALPCARHEGPSLDANADATSNNTVSSNTIAFNGLDGVGIVAFSNIANANLVLGNSIFSNVEEGIDLGANGPTPNDAGDADSSPNTLQNFPVIT